VTIVVRTYNVHMCHGAKFHKKNRLNRGRDMVIFQDGGHRHLGFSKFQFFNGRMITLPSCCIQRWTHSKLAMRDDHRQFITPSVHLS